MHFGSRLFVAVLFSLLALAFWAVTIQLYLEFGHDASVWGLHKSAPDLDAITASLRAHDNEIWFLLLTHHSDLFLFFPVFGTIALIAFFTPACVFVDMYWNTARLEPDQRIPLSRLRFLVGLVITVAASFSLANYVQDGKERTLWQLKPEVLKTDRGEACTNGQSCARVAFLDALANLRRTSRERVTLYDLGRACTDDWFVDPPRPIRPPRYCPVSTNILGKPETLKGTWVDDRTCCAAQQRFDAAVKAKYANPANRSQTNTFEAALWPAHMFFLLILLALSALLAFRRNRVEELYPTYSNAIDRGVLIGTMAMVFLPLMHNGFLLTTKLLHGNAAGLSLHRQPETFSVAFGAWALLIILSFLHPANKQAEVSARILGVIATIIFALKADTVTDYTIYWFGAGAGAISLAVMVGLAVSLLVALWLWRQAETLAANAADPPTKPDDS
jgi:hypothetical protein